MFLIEAHLDSIFRNLFVVGLVTRAISTRCGSVFWPVFEVSGTVFDTTFETR
jgi:hypothetical protein